MLIGVYSMRDTVAGLYQSPTFELNEAVAKRNFSYAVNHSDFYKFAASNVDLYHLGSFDTETGVITPCEPELILSGVTAVLNGEQKNV